MLNKTAKKLVRGFSLIEIMAAMAILTIGMLSILSIFPVGIESYETATNDTKLANLMRSKVNDLLYMLSDPNMDDGRRSQSKTIAKHYLMHDRAFALYMDESDKDKRWSGAVYDSEVYPFEDDPSYFWQYTVTDIGKSGSTKIGPRGTKGVFFQVEFKVYKRDQIENENVPMDLSIVKTDQKDNPIMRQVFRVHNPYPAIKYGKK